MHAAIALPRALDLFAQDVVAPRAGSSSMNAYISA
jgi:hypothetical protein